MPKPLAVDSESHSEFLNVGWKCFSKNVSVIAETFDSVSKRHLTLTSPYKTSTVGNPKYSYSSSLGTLEFEPDWTSPAAGLVITGRESFPAAQLYGKTYHWRLQCTIHRVGCTVTATQYGQLPTFKTYRLANGFPFTLPPIKKLFLQPGQGIGPPICSISIRISRTGTLGLFSLPETYTLPLVRPPHPNDHKFT